MRVCVYCASSEQCDPIYREAAGRLGTTLADAGCSIVYGGGAGGLMGALADAALAQGGHVTGIIPGFMTEVEWQHTAVSDLQIVGDMRERKHRLLTGSDAVVAMAGGFGTLEELFEALSLKRLGLYLNPVILLNTAGFYQPLHEFMCSQIDKRFLNAAHRDLWSLVDEPEDVLARIRATPPWRQDALDFAVSR